MLKTNLLFFIGVIVSCVSLLQGCATNAQGMISKRLDIDTMNSKLGTKTDNLADGGMCPGTKSLIIVNTQDRKDQYCINEVLGGCRWYIIPKEFNEEVVSYIGKRLVASNVTVGAGSNLAVSLEKLKSQEGVWSFGSNAELKIHLPDINYTKTYVAENGSGLGDLAAAYAIHLAIDDFFKDPVFQNYLRCTKK